VALGLVFVVLLLAFVLVAGWFILRNSDGLPKPPPTEAQEVTEAPAVPQPDTEDRHPDGGHESADSETPAEPTTGDGGER
jgi:hypothetical protein